MKGCENDDVHIDLPSPAPIRESQGYDYMSKQPWCHGRGSTLRLDHTAKMKKNYI